MFAEQPRTDEERALQAYMWEHADLSYLLHAGNREREEWALQREQHRPDVQGQRGLRDMFYGSAASVIVWNIARRWGKSLLCCVLALEEAIRSERAEVRYGAPSGTMVATFIDPLMIALQEEAHAVGRPDLAPTWRSTKKLDFWEVPRTKSRIYIKGCEDTKKADALRGPSTRLFILDEAGFIPILDYVVKSVAGPQMLTTEGKMLIVSTPPLSPEHPFAKTFIAKAKQQDAYVHRTVYDAPHLSDEKIEDYAEEVCGGVGTVDWQREGLALIVTDPARAIVPEFGVLEDQIVTDIEREAYVDRYVIGDGGFEDLFAVGFWEWHPAQGVFFLVDELYFHNQGTTEVCPAIAHKEMELWGSFIRVEPGTITDTRGTVDYDGTLMVPDASIRVVRRVDLPPISRRDMSIHHGQRWGGVTKTDRFGAVNSLRQAVGFAGIVPGEQQITTKPGYIRIHPRCEQTIAHLRGGMWNVGRTAFERSGDMGHFDGVDMSKYAVRHLDRTSNARAPLHGPGVTPDTHHIATTKRDAGKRHLIRSHFGRKTGTNGRS